MNNKFCIVMGIFLIFAIGSSVALPAESQITLEEIENELGQGRKLDKAELWRKLGIKSKDKEYKDRFLEKGAWEHKLIASGFATLYRLDEFKILQVSNRFGEYCLLIFQEQDGKWIYQDHISMDRQNYVDPKLTFYETRDDTLLFSVISLKGSGTGIRSYAISFYKHIGNTIKPVLTVLKKGHVFGWGLMFDREYEAFIWPYFYTRPDGLGLTCYINYYGNSHCYRSKLTDVPKRFLLFSLKADVCFRWNEKEKTYAIVKTMSGLTKEEINLLFLAGEKEFYRMHKEKIEALLVGGNKYQKEWAEIFLKRISAEQEIKHQ